MIWVICTTSKPITRITTPMCAHALEAIQQRGPTAPPIMQRFAMVVISDSFRMALFARKMCALALLDSLHCGPTVPLTMPRFVRVVTLDTCSMASHQVLARTPMRGSLTPARQTCALVLEARQQQWLTASSTMQRFVWIVTQNFRRLAMLVLLIGCCVQPWGLLGVHAQPDSRSSAR